MKLKKLMAGSLAAAMVVGNGMTVLASDASSATGTGSAFDHVNKEVTSVTLPTTAEVANVFNYYVDPERLINSAETLTDGTAVDKNNDGVYFAHPGAAEVPATPASVTAFSLAGGTIDQTTDADSDDNPDVTITLGDTTITATTLTYDGSDWKDGDSNTVSVTINAATAPTLQNGDTITVSPYVAGTPAGAATYSSTSEAVEFEGRNSVDVDVSVTATVAATAGGKDIAIVSSADELAAATTPALLMTLTVGSDSKAITSDAAGVKATATVVGKPNNFAVTANTSTNKFEYDVRTNTDTENGGTALDAWDSTTLTLSGKTNQKDVSADGMTAPQINLTWTIGKHQTTPPAPTYTEETAYGTWGGNDLWLAKDSSDGFSSNSLTVEVSDGGTNYTALASDKYSVNDANWVSVSWDNIAEALGGEPSGTVYIRVTDGTTRYTFTNN
ncbi:MAG TPA: hypothetical protein DF613_10690 [Lachnospiraceae bacterium]|nr:hypothetical protein [Lachnospiraceae bacterium]